MEIIDELEPERRGFYAGAVGYFAADGTMDTCIALRTALIKDGRMYVQAGGGVVAVRVLTSKSTYNQLELPSGRLSKVNTKLPSLSRANSL